MIRIQQVDGRRGLARFVDAPWKILDRRVHPNWVPPLRSHVRELLDERRHPFYDRAARALFLAERGGRVVGRIAAIENRAHNEFQGDRVGFFGFFESVDDQEVADGLLERASGWLAERGLEAIRGPMSPSTNYDCGTLVDGYDVRPTFLTTWNPPYYPVLLERARMEPIKELLSYWISVGDDRPPVPERMRVFADRARAQSGITFREVDLRRFPEEVERFWKVYASAWSDNWGFVPVTHEEFRHMARDLRHLLVEQFVLVAEHAGETVGFILVVLDYNEALARIGNGRLLPTGIFRILREKRRLRVGRVMVLGIRPEFRGRSIMPLFFDELIRRGSAYGGIGADASWILADNKAMRAPLEAIGAPVTRRWHIYERPLPPAPR